MARATLADRRDEVLGGRARRPRPASPARAGAWARRCGACSTRRGSSSTPASGGRRWPPPPARRSPGRPRATRTSSSTSRSGARGSRHDHVEGLLRELTGAEAALAVNNCAAATLLAAAALAAGRDLVVSRGQLVEIGGGFRIPEVVAQAGARLVEVGTTNRTRLADYAQAVRTSADDRRDPARAPVELPHRRLRRGGARSRRSAGSACPSSTTPAPASSPTTSTSLAGEPPVRAVGARGRRARGLQRRQAPRRPAGRAARRHARRRRGLPPAPARPRACGSTSCRSPPWRRRCALYRDPALARRELPVLAMLTADDATLAPRAQRLADATGGDRRRGGRPRRRRGAAAARAPRARRRAGGGDPGRAGGGAPARRAAGRRAHRATGACSSTRAR